jgi:hypothetical protein
LRHCLLTLTGQRRFPLRFCFELHFHACKQKRAEKSRLPHDHARKNACPLEDVVEQPRFAASEYQFFTVS